MEELKRKDIEIARLWHEVAELDRLLVVKSNVIADYHLLVTKVSEDLLAARLKIMELERLVS